MFGRSKILTAGGATVTVELLGNLTFYSPTTKAVGQINRLTACSLSASKAVIIPGGNNVTSPAWSRAWLVGISGTTVQDLYMLSDFMVGPQPLGVCSSGFDAYNMMWCYRHGGTYPATISMNCLTAAGDYSSLSSGNRLDVTGITGSIFNVCCFDSSTGVLAYYNGTDVKLVPILKSGSTLSSGTIASMTSGGSVGDIKMHKIDSTRVLLVLGSWEFGIKACVITLTGSDVAAGATTVISNAIGYQSPITAPVMFDTTYGLVHSMWDDYEGGDGNWYRALSVSGNAVTALGSLTQYPAPWGEYQGYALTAAAFDSNYAVTTLNVGSPRAFCLKNVSGTITIPSNTSITAGYYPGEDMVRLDSITALYVTATSPYATINAKCVKLS